MGLIENCNRVKQNVENIYTVLEENGIVIPEGTTSDNLSGLISTNTVNLDDELAEQDSLLAELQTTLEGKASGGGSGVEVETCTVRTWCGGVAMIIMYSTYIDGKISTIYTTEQYNNFDCEAILENVVKNSEVFLFLGDSVSDGHWSLTNAEFLSFVHDPADAYYIYRFLITDDNANIEEV